MNRAIGVTALAACSLAFALSATGLRLNFTDSAPRGLWIENPSVIPERGMLVSVCPPATALVKIMSELGYLGHGNCPETNSTPFLKAVSALPGDHVRIRADQPAIVNGYPLWNTKASKKLPSWPDGDYIVQDGQIWVFSTYNKDSLDSRYFGPVPVQNVRGKADPLIVDGSVRDMTIGVIND